MKPENKDRFLQGSPTAYPYKDKMREMEKQEYEQLKQLQQEQQQEQLQPTAGTV
jgi:hypothetical protein